jgi:hypothetical protein
LLSKVRKIESDFAGINGPAAAGTAVGNGKNYCIVRRSDILIIEITFHYV